jgi:sulfur relay (sulfurtransferase) complex TusBCD TusD component (DsrE family)
MVDALHSEEMVSLALSRLIINAKPSEQSAQHINQLLCNIASEKLKIVFFMDSVQISKSLHVMFDDMSDALQTGVLQYLDTHEPVHVCILNADDRKFAAEYSLPAKSATVGAVTALSAMLLAIKRVFAEPSDCHFALMDFFIQGAVSEQNVKYEDIVQRLSTHGYVLK